MSFYAKTVAHWKMNDNAASATVVDAMTNYNGTYKDKDGNLNTNTGALAGMVNGALDFDGVQPGGTDEYVDTGDSFQSTFRASFSISVWVKPTDGQPGSSIYIVGADSGIGQDIVFLILDSLGNLSFFYYSDGDSAKFTATSASFSNGQETWHHVVIVADSTIGGVGGLVMYIDGVKPTSHAIFNGDTSGVTFADFTTALSLYIGCENIADGTPGNFFDGLIDNVILFNVALTGDEARRLYNNGHGTEILAELEERRTPRRGTSPHGYRARYEFAKTVN